MVFLRGTSLFLLVGPLDWLHRYQPLRNIEDSKSTQSLTRGSNLGSSSVIAGINDGSKKSKTSPFDSQNPSNQPNQPIQSISNRPKLPTSTSSSSIAAKKVDFDKPYDTIKHPDDPYVKVTSSKPVIFDHANFKVLSVKSEVPYLTGFPITVSNVLTEKLYVLRNVCLVREVVELPGQRIPVLINRFTAVPSPTRREYDNGINNGVGGDSSSSTSSDVLYPQSAAFQAGVGVCCFGQTNVLRGVITTDRSVSKDLVGDWKRVDEEANAFTAEDGGAEGDSGEEGSEGQGGERDLFGGSEIDGGGVGGAGFRKTRVLTDDQSPLEKMQASINAAMGGRNEDNGKNNNNKKPALGPSALPGPNLDLWRTQTSKLTSRSPFIPEGYGVIIARTKYFGNFYHTLWDILIPLYLTKRTLGWEKTIVLSLGRGAQPRSFGSDRLHRMAREVGILFRPTIVGEIHGVAGIALAASTEEAREEEEQSAIPQLVNDPVRVIQDDEPICVSEKEPGISVNWLGGTKPGGYPWVMTAEAGFGFLPGFVKPMREMHDSLRFKKYDGRWSGGLDYWKGVGRGHLEGIKRSFSKANEGDGETWVSGDVGEDLLAGASVDVGEKTIGKWLNGFWIRRKHRELSNLDEVFSRFVDEISSTDKNKDSSSSPSFKKIARLNEIGIQPLHLETLPYPTKLKKALASVDFLMGTTGAGFANQLFLRPYSRAVVIDCSHCLAMTPSLNLQYPGKCNEVYSPYLRVHALHYLIDTPEGPPGGAAGGEEQKKPFPRIPDVDHYWRVVTAFFEETEVENLGKYFEGGWKGGKGKGGEIDAGDVTVPTTLLCDANSKDRYLICRPAGTDILDPKARVFEVKGDGKVEEVGAGGSGGVKYGEDSFIEPYFVEQRTYLQALVDRKVSGAKEWAGKGVYGMERKNETIKVERSR